MTGFGDRSMGANSHVLKELISINRLYVTDITHMSFYQIVRTFYDMKKVVYIELHPDHGVWERLVEMEDDKILTETPWHRVKSRYQVPLDPIIIR